MSFDGRVVAGGTLAGYRVLELAGRGGTGEVYRARDERLQRDVALKLLSPDFAADATFRARLARVSTRGQPRSSERRPGVRRGSV